MSPEPGAPDVVPDPERLGQGWERRFIADDTRIAEMVQLYRDMGYETVVDPVRPADLRSECGECPLVLARRLKAIYTRRASGAPGA